MKETVSGALKAHSLNIEGRSRAVITGVEDVELFNGEQIAAVTSQGAIMVGGSNLHVENLNLTDGQLVITGKVDRIEYDERAPKAKNVIGRIFR